MAQACIIDVVRVAGAEMLAQDKGSNATTSADLPSRVIDAQATMAFSP